MAVPRRLPCCLPGIDRSGRTTCAFPQFRIQAENVDWPPPWFRSCPRKDGCTWNPSQDEGNRQWEAFKHGDLTAILLEPYLTFSGGGYGSGWRRNNGASVAGYTRTLRACHGLLHATNASITSCDWAGFDWSSLTHDDFVFFDPPYIDANVRSYKKNDINHEDLVRLLKTANFKWMLTEYRHELYLRELGQPFFTKDVQLNTVNFHVTGGQERRQECVWANYRVPD